ncbi:Thymidine kinase [Nosema granulosis]|uniref:Thymidine kinase n=1 Tax=Nosema granulosis TaxID=83296 RepID=A0A9P6GWE0_9MICR|nr:Thymidine kinase [Nosema granulosis]
MGSLRYIYGMVMAGKTAKFIKDVKNEKSNHYIMKPDIDYEIKKEKIVSRNGTEVKANILITKTTDLLNDINYNGIEKLYIDEAQFLSPSHVEQLKQLTILKDLDVLCYGLRTDFKSKLFEGATRLFEICDYISEIESKCNYCPKKATHNIKIVDGMCLAEGQTIQLSSETDVELYWPCCYKCYNELIKSKKIKC